MRKMDEMERTIQLRSGEVGYKVLLISLCAWIMYNCWQVLANGAEYNPLPVLIVCISVLTQTTYYMAMKHKMVAGDEEFKEPNRLVQTIIALFVVVIVILSLGIYFTLKV